MSNNICTNGGKQVEHLGAGSLQVADLSAIFVDPGKRDYRLKAGSPAIGAGVAVGFEKDIVGNKAPPGKAPDLGAYQYAPTP